MFLKPFVVSSLVLQGVSNHPYPSIRDYVPTQDERSEVCN
jgi:hypothetical protein